MLRQAPYGLSNIGQIKSDHGRWSLWADYRSMEETHPHPKLMNSAPRLPIEQAGKVTISDCSGTIIRDCRWWRELAAQTERQRPYITGTA